MKIGVSLLTCNNRAHPELLRATQDTVQSLLASDLMEHETCFAVVDNGSNDGTAVWLRDTLPSGSSVLEQGRNLGIARGRNVAARVLLVRRCQFLLEIHNDMVFPRRWFAPLLVVMQTRERCGLVAPALICGRPVHGAPIERLPVGLPLAEKVKRVEAAAEHARPRWQGVRPGLLHPALKRITMLQEIGLYCEEFRGRNFEDTEEAYRMMQAGWDMLICRDAWVWHAYSLSWLKVGAEVPMAQNEAVLRRRHPDHPVLGAKLKQMMAGIYA